MFFVGVGTAVPPRRYSQRECWQALQGSPQFRALDTRSRATLRHILLAEGNGIAARHLALESLEEAFEIQPDVLDARFARHAPQLAAAAARAALKDAGLRARDMDAVLVSTCTGYLCPGLSSYVSQQLGLRSDALLLDLVGQGCGAALPNMRAAEALLRSDGCEHVLSICVEVCSAAFYVDDDPGVLVSACLFGDGAGAAVLARAPSPEKRRLEWKSARSETSPEERDLLRFERRGGLLRNILTPQVPLLAARHAAALLLAVLAETGLERQQIAAWIWHAGGTRVLECLRAETGLGRADVERSARVLNDVGNVSSAFVYFVLERALRERAPGGPWWLSSFGAGFSCHGALLEAAAA
jgi:alkylresorcinol/alkylpyrone synthase